MSHLTIAHSPDIQQLIAEGYEVRVLHEHLLMESVPYVTLEREVRYDGVLACPYGDGRPADHTVWFKGMTPCTCEGEPLRQVINHSNASLLFEGFKADHYFSNKPTGIADFPDDFFVKMTHYANHLVAQARGIDPDADARTRRVLESRVKDGIFVYGDSASARAGITAITQKLRRFRIAIVGLGGTGSYILDHVAKTPVGEIHLFDGDDYNRHNAFRSPGAASIEQLQANPKKVEYFAQLYGVMRRGIFTHPYALTERNISELSGFDFVFVAVDHGLSRRLICHFLRDEEIPFIDVGMGLRKDEDALNIAGQCRATLCTATQREHLDTHVDMHNDDDEALYASNIQVSDMNAFNALLAVTMWKQYCGFYANSTNAHNLIFALDFQSLTRDVTPENYSS